ncbi:5-methylcytosine-specific restriction enzyme A [Moraxella cuniculi DSM 21768]|uniref:Putative HNH nuclease YajD n=2 Tax=Moraxella cuniculi TaxID=34061 RepID=A0A1N7G4U1_9GAMM|nr:5-methylcytosine-specific restriction enzyme A [Moraxella cuniculi DSM 21768]
MQGYCDTHAHLRYNWRHTRSASERGYGSAWRRLRAQILQRDNYLCQACKANGRYTTATDVDHIQAKAHGGTDSPDNLQSLCRACHKSKTATEGRAGKKF